MLTLYADGASRGNPGPASYGAALFDGETQLAGLYDTLGVRTNNFAEYSAVIAGLQYIVDNGLGPEVLVRMDSKLVVEQLSGRWKIKHPDMQVLAKEARDLLAGTTVTFEWIPREENSRADAAANKALDVKQSYVER
jgi:probable phosphoglycerate mutase